MLNLNEQVQLGPVQTIPVRTPSKTNNGTKAPLLSLLAHKANETIVLAPCQKGHQPRGDDEINLTDVFLHGGKLNIVSKKDKTIPVCTTETNNVKLSKASLLSLAHEAKERGVREACPEGHQPRGGDELDSANVFPHGAELKTAPKKSSDKSIRKRTLSCR